MDLLSIISDKGNFSHALLAQVKKLFYSTARHENDLARR